MLDIKGNRRISSTSKTRKIIAIRKNRKVKGNRALNLGVNPHSKGLSFSRSLASFFLRAAPRQLTIKVKAPPLIKNNLRVIIV